MDDRDVAIVTGDTSYLLPLLRAAMAPHLSILPVYQPNPGYRQTVHEHISDLIPQIDTVAAEEPAPEPRRQYIPLREYDFRGIAANNIQVGDVVRIVEMLPRTQFSASNFTILKVKPIGKGRIQVKAREYWLKTAPVRKFNIPADSMVTLYQRNGEWAGTPKV